MAAARNSGPVSGRSRRGGAPTSAGAARSPYRTYRQPIGMRTAAVLGAASAVAAGVAALHGKVVAAGGLLALAAVLAWAGWWVRLVVDRDGLTVWNVRRRRMAWADVERIGLEDPSWSYGPTLTLYAGPRRVRVWAVSTTRGGGAGYVQRTAEELRRAQEALGRRRQ